MSREEQLSWEARWAPPAAAIAALSGILAIAGGILARAAITQRPNDAVESLKLIDQHSGAFLSSTFPQGIGTALFSGILLYLFHATRFRREQLPPFVRYLVFAPILAGILAIVHQFQVVSVAHEVARQLPLAPQAADDLVKAKTSSGAYEAIGLIATLAGLAMVAATVMISLNAMRAGLLSRFIGTIGVIVGVLMILPLTEIPVVQAFWSFAMAVLFLDRWPQGGRGPAWATGEAIPWPTMQTRQQELTAAKVDREVEDEEPERTPVAAGHHVDEEPVPARRQAPQHPRSKKRKRKRR